MKRTILASAILFLSIICFNCKAQDAVKATDAGTDKIFTIVEEMPVFPGGEKALSKFIKRNLSYPDDAKKNGVQGKVYVTFVVDAMGKIRDAKVMRGIGSGCDEEALRIVNAMPAWTPGKQKGKAVNVKFVQPFNFLL
jgi:protein TonB